MTKIVTKIVATANFEKEKLIKPRFSAMFKGIKMENLFLAVSNTLAYAQNRRIFAYFQ